MPQSRQDADTDPTPAATQRAPLKASPFKLVRVEKTDEPQGGSGETWYRYVLDNGRSIIAGKRSGALKDVTAYATQYAEQLNARSLSGHSAWSPRAKKPA